MSYPAGLFQMTRPMRTLPRYGSSNPQAFRPMATLIPSLSSRLSRMTSGEKRFAQRLEAKLEEDYLCWYDLPVGPANVHPDFIVLHPKRGLIILEVKDWKPDTLRAMTRADATLLTDAGMKRVPNPLEQARQYAHAVVDVLEKDPQLTFSSGRMKGRLLFPWTYGVVLANISRRQFEAAELAEVLEPHRVICQDEMTESAEAEAFQQRLWDMFHLGGFGHLSLPQLDRIRWHLIHGYVSSHVRCCVDHLLLSHIAPVSEHGVREILQSDDAIARHIVPRHRDCQACARCAGRAR